MLNREDFDDFIAVNEAAEQIKMKQWVAECGTHGCLIGNWALTKSSWCPVTPLVIATGFLLDVRQKAAILAERLGVTQSVAGFLFIGNFYKKSAKHACHLPGPEALARLKKVYAFLSRRQELIDAGETWRAMPRRERRKYWNEQEVRAAA